MMGNFTFRYLEKGEISQFLPKVFDILYENMTTLFSSESDYAEDRKQWERYILPALEQGKTRILLMFGKEELAGYVQYSLEGDTFRVDEVEIRRPWQRTMLFYRCCQFLLADLGDRIRWVESYVNKTNENSLAIHRKLGMEAVGENRSGSSWKMRGDGASMARRFVRK